MYFRYFGHNDLSLTKGMTLHLNKLESSSPKNALCKIQLNLAMWFFRERWKCEKFTDRRTQTEGQTPGTGILGRGHISHKVKMLNFFKNHFSTSSAEQAEHRSNKLSIYWYWPRKGLPKLYISLPLGQGFLCLGMARLVEMLNSF